METQARSMGASALSRRLIIPLIAIALFSASCGQSVTFAHEVGDCEAPPDQSDAFEPLMLPDGYSFVCGSVSANSCLQLGREQQFASLEVEEDRATIEYLGDRSQLSETCSEDIAPVIIVVSAEAAELPSSLPIYFDGSRIERIG